MCRPKPGRLTTRKSELNLNQNTMEKIKEKTERFFADVKTAFGRDRWNPLGVVVLLLLVVMIIAYILS